VTGKPLSLKGKVDLDQKRTDVALFESRSIPSVIGD
jgi:hypothetical protein